MLQHLDPGDARPFVLDPEGRCLLTHGDAARRCAAVAAALAGRGVRRDDRVAVAAPKSVEALLVQLACLRAGLVLVPVNPAATPAELAHVVRDAAPAMVLGGAEVVALVAEAGAGSDSSALPALPAADDLAALLYTSGTTGRPKGAMLTHGNLASNIATLAELWAFTADDVLLHALPAFHTHGLFVATGCVLAAKASMRYLPRFEVDAALAALPGCTVMMGVPTFYARLLADPRLDRERCAHVRLFVSGSAPLPPSVHEQWQARTGHAILERYGMTETVMLTSNPLDGERRPGTVGLPLPGVEVRIAGGAEVGVVEVRGPNVFLGYWGRPDLDATERTADGFFRTGDIGTFDDDGYLRLVGRAKDLIISGGLNVYPQEVEDVVDRCRGVAESAVVGVPDDDWGEAVVAVVVAVPGEVVDAEGLRAEARRHLAAYKVPKRVLVVEELPRNSMGKVEKAALRATLAGTAAGGTPGQGAH